MKILIIIWLLPLAVLSQSMTNYGANSEFPFGLLNPDAPEEVADYAPMIGICDCKSTARKADQTWGETQNMVWTFKYVLNGTAVQDDSFKEDGSHSGSLRQFIADSSKWYVHWYSNLTPSTSLPTWEGGKRGDSIVLYNEQKAPNGMDGFYRITFSNISEDGFNWIGEWVNTAETFSYPTWKIDCVKRKADTDEAVIRKKILAFSKAYVDADYDSIANSYTEDGHIFPTSGMIVSGREDIKKRWTLPEGARIVHHKITPSEITVLGDYAYDYGYYEGSMINTKNKQVNFKGKYVILWKKVEAEWKMYLDIWNRI